MSEIDGAVKATFRTIGVAMSVVCNTVFWFPCSFQHLILLQVQYHHFIQLKEDAAASLGISHVISKVAANFVAAQDNQLMTQMGLTPNVWHSEPMKEMRAESSRLREAELLKWAGVDLSARTV